MPAVSGRWVGRLGEGLEAPRFRCRLYAGLGLALFALALLSTCFKKQFNFVVSDSRFYYVYLPSLVIDGDLDFTNQMREHWDGDWRPNFDEVRTERGLVKNKYPIGVALTLTPSFLAGHAIALVCHRATGAAWCAPDGYSVPYQVCNLVWLLALAAGTMMLADRLLTRHFAIQPRATFLAVVTYWLGTNYLYYTVRQPFMSHLAGAFWVTAALVAVAALVADLERRRLSGVRLFLLTFSTSMALVCRPTNAFVLPFGAYLLYRIVRAGRFGALLRRAPAVAAGLAPLAAQMAVWYGLYGHVVMYSYEDEGFHWAHPAAWQTLFSSRNGLFFWSPLLLVAAGGIARRLRPGPGRPEPLLLCFVGSFLLLWYCNSCWHCWWFGDSFGARAFVELSALFVLGLASAFEAVLHAGPAARRVLVTAVVAAVAYHFVMLGLHTLRLVPHDSYLF